MDREGCISCSMCRTDLSFVRVILMDTAAMWRTNDLGMARAFLKKSDFGILLISRP